MVRQPLDLWGQRGWFVQEVAGESHYFEAIRQVLGATVDSNGIELIVTTQLVPEPSNKYDKNAVQVVVNGQVVGYLPREDAARHGPVLAALVKENWIPQVNARVWGRLYTNHDYDSRGRLVESHEFMGSVRLDLAEPHLLVPANLPPQRRHVVLPLGGAIQVSGEEQHMPDLLPFVSTDGECWIHVTLHELVEQTARTTKTVVEVRADGAAVGKLTPKMSSELLPVIQHLEAQGVTTACRAILKGNKLKADVTLYTARSGEVSAEWLDQPPVVDAGRTSGHDAVIVLDERAPNDDNAPPSVQQWRFNPPPGWPPAPPGWMPPPEWIPPSHLPPAPAGWQWWLPN